MNAPTESPLQGYRPPLPRTIGRYEVVRLLGEGAMGRVILASDPVLGREVAIKLLRSDLQIPRDVREGLVVRMRHEARAAARVAHPNIVTLHDMGEDPALGLYLVFEFVEGPTLKQRLAQQGPLPPRLVARLARELGSALAEAHTAGIVHRDIKPENVILSKTGGKIADFGIARLPDSTLTHQGGLLGTPAYSAPETFRSGTFSPASDQFSLAASLYEALSGKRAFPGDDAAFVTARIANEMPAPIAREAGVPAAVDDVLARAMAKQPEDRHPSCSAFGRALASALANGHASAGDGADDLGSDAIEDIEALSSTTPPAWREGREKREGREREPAPPPRARTPGQVVLGAAVVVATAALIVRAGLQSAENASSADAPMPSANPTASATASAAVAARPRPPAPLSSPRTPKARSVAGTDEPLPSASASAAASGAASAVPPEPRAAIAGDAGAAATSASDAGAAEERAPSGSDPGDAASAAKTSTDGAPPRPHVPAAAPSSPTP